MFATALVGMLWAVSAGAVTISPAAGWDLTANATQSNELRVFSEKTNVTVTGGVFVNYLASDIQGVETNGFTNTTGLSPVELAANTYHSFMVHFDPDITAGSAGVTDIAIDFGFDIVALIFTNLDETAPLLASSDAIFGTATAYDDHTYRGFEANDSLTVNGSVLEIHRMAANSLYVDNIRVITHVPVPASMPLMIAGFGAFVSARRRQRQPAARKILGS